MSWSIFAIFIYLYVNFSRTLNIMTQRLVGYIVGHAKLACDSSVEHHIHYDDALIEN